ncbi:MAG: SrfA family protein [Proteobacteria bacterium]|nr:SrfA family protein [Pseudomonadota bacterium]
MAAGPLLVSEPLQRYRALGLAGDPVWRAAGQLRTAVAARLSRRHADLLAIPEVDPTGQRIDWYAPFDGTPRRLAELDPAARDAVLADVQRLHAEISTLADGMEAPERSAAERNFARLLRHALTAPGEDTLYVVDGKPVMTFWGFTAEASLPGAFLAVPPAVAPRVPPPPVAARPEAVLASAPAAAAIVGPARSTWWQWLLLAVLLLLLLAFLAWLVRPYLPRIEPWLEAEARERALSLAVRQPAEIQKARFDTLQQENEALQMELARLTDEASRRGADCAAAVLVPGVGGVVAGAAPIERGALPDDKAPGNGPGNLKGPDDKKVDKADTKNGPDGNKDGQKDAAKNDPKTEPKPMVVPPESKQKQDLSFLKGDWRSRTGLATATGERDLRPNYTLDDKGKGKVTFVQQNGATCEAPAEARWDGQKLVIEEKTNPRCSDGKTYARNTVNCEVGADGVAKCSGSQPGDNRSYNVQFGR